MYIHIMIRREDRVVGGRGREEFTCQKKRYTGIIVPACFMTAELVDERMRRKKEGIVSYGVYVKENPITVGEVSVVWSNCQAFWLLG